MCCIIVPLFVLILVLPLIVVTPSKFPRAEYIIETETLPEDLNWMPILSNGHIALQLLSPNVYKNGLYNGKHGLSHRARLPNYSNVIIPQIQFNGSTTTSFTYRMNHRHGIFETLIRADNSIHIRHQVYAHRYYDRAVVNEIILTRLGSDSGEVRVAIALDPGNEDSDDLTFDAPVKGENYTTKCGHTKEMEVPETETDDYLRPKQSRAGKESGLERVCVVWSHVPEEITLDKRATKSFYKFIMTVDRDLLVAEQEMRNVLLRPDLMESHVREWETFWGDFNVRVKGNDLELSRSIHASIYGIVSALPSKKTSSRVVNDLFYGLSPTGLGRGGSTLSDYEGHNFWDTEIWMFPAVLIMDNSNWSRQLLHYRFAKLEAARQYARGSHYEGARFPWESAYSGTEVTQPCCPEVAANQHHITADIGVAIENYYYATGDRDWMRSEGCELIHEITKFIASRVIYNVSMDRYEVRGVMGPDEDHGLVDNNLYTNVAFKRVLEFALNISSLCNFNVPSKWIEIVQKMVIIYNSEHDYHPQYEGYEIGTIVKQADVILAGYPLMYQMNRTTRRNDLEMYEQVTRSTGPAMTWSMFAINYLELNESEKAEKHFRNGYQKYLQPPFYVWREVATDQTVDGSSTGDNNVRRSEKGEEAGAVNFLTGAGGFLQSIFFGYAGLRVLNDRLVINAAERLMPATNGLTINGIKYRGLSIDLIVREEVRRGQSNRFSLRFRECMGRGRRVQLIFNDTVINVICKQEQSEWYNWTTGGATIKVFDPDN